LDGTIANIDHRKHLVEPPKCPKCDGSGLDLGMHHHYDYDCGACGGKGKDKSFKPNWDAFFEACVHDKPVWPVIGVLIQLYEAAAEIQIWSGRMDTVSQQTISWLYHNLHIIPPQLVKMLRMRPGGDFTPDEQLKKKWLHLMPKEDRLRLIAVFDDRQKVVDMWRKEGVACFQVAPGDF
jgi:hypothetical protein